MESLAMQVRCSAINYGVIIVTLFIFILESPNLEITSSSSTGDLCQSICKPTNSPSLTDVSTPGNRNVCKNKKCRYCPMIDTSSIAKYKSTGKMFECKKNISCKSSNLIYLITNPNAESTKDSKDITAE